MPRRYCQCIPSRGAPPFGVRLLGATLLLALVLGIASAHVPFGADAYDEGLMVQGAAL